MATAIHVISESMDHYNYAVDEDLTGEQVLSFLKGKLDEEYDYISEIFANLSDDSDIKINY